MDAGKKLASNLIFIVDDKLNNNKEVKSVSVTSISGARLSDHKGFLILWGLFFNTGLSIYTKECIITLDNISNMNRCIKCI